MTQRISISLPYSADYVSADPAEQEQRSHRITAFAQKPAEFAVAGRAHAEHAFVVHGTIADPRWLDPTLEPNGRKPGWSYLGDPEVANTSPGALMRFTTTRSWLPSRVLRLRRSMPVTRRPAPACRLWYSSTGETTRSDQSPAPGLRCNRAPDKDFVNLPGANHYFSGANQKSDLATAADLLHDWACRHGFLTS